MNLSALLVTVLLSTSAQVEPAPTAPVEPSASKSPRRAVWIRPLGLTLLAGEGQQVVVAAGVSFPLDEQRGLALELNVSRGLMERDKNVGSSFTAVSLSGGPTYSSRGLLSGFFVQPKLIGVLINDVDYFYEADAIQHQGGTAFQLKAGVEAGWQFVLGPLYGSVGLGLSAGLGFNNPKGAYTGMMLGPEIAGYASEREDVAPALDFQINLLRLGAAF
ncbi:hypothetical protein [Hyalangium rubrum]|uniref:Outer membrane protein beta-barrel domain-containing protein n=1 Tax=Hyalangium rubrum TaxID=3103134 RepID=A0ABU5HJM4_9BACT|nr:hypothetical protein [Hyalangium sp. s54d21]MDY7232285.1 hypothetical protein [Hyalangium sp. s54d21]